MNLEAFKSSPWDLWSRQLRAVVRLELKRIAFTRRAWWIYLLALAPVALLGLHSLVMTQKRSFHSIPEDGVVFATIFQIFYLRMAIFFACVGVFFSLIRGEVLEKTIHYYLLAPIRRELLVAGKYLAGLIATASYFAASVTAGFLLISAHFGQAYWDFVFRGPGLGQLGWYLLSAVLACAGYGAAFLLLGLRFRNPMIPAALVLLWETNNWLLPAVAQRISIVYYLKSLAPVAVPRHNVLLLLAIDPGPSPAWLAIAGLLALSLGLLVLAALRARRFEAAYAE